MRRILYALILCPALVAAQQDIQFTQFHNAPIRLNPATAGVFYGSFRASAAHRIQWHSMTQNITSSNFSFDMPLLSELTGQDLFGVGINVGQDEAGSSAFKSLTANINLNYGKAFDRDEKHFISFGMMGGYGQREINYDALNWGKQWDVTGYNQSLPSFEPANPSTNMNFVDVASGLHYFYSDHQAWQTQLGFVVGHLNRPQIGFYEGEDLKLDRKYTFHGSAEYHSHSNKVAISPKILWVQHGELRSITLGSEFDFLVSEAGKILGKTKEVTIELALFYRWKDALSPMLGFNLAGWTIASSYDFTVSSLTPTTSGLGGPEFHVIYKGGYKKGLKERHSNDRFDRIH